MNKLLITLLASAFAVTAFTQAPKSESKAPASAEAKKDAKKPAKAKTEKKAKAKKDEKAATK